MFFLGKALGGKMLGGGMILRFSSADESALEPKMERPPLQLPLRGTHRPLSRDCWCRRERWVGVERAQEAGLCIPFTAQSCFLL